MGLLAYTLRQEYIGRVGPPAFLSTCRGTIGSMLHISISRATQPARYPNPYMYRYRPMPIPGYPVHIDRGPLSI